MSAAAERLPQSRLLSNNTSPPFVILHRPSTVPTLLILRSAELLGATICAAILVFAAGRKRSMPSVVGGSPNRGGGKEDVGSPKKPPPKPTIHSPMKSPENNRPKKRVNTTLDAAPPSQPPSTTHSGDTMYAPPSINRSVAGTGRYATTERSDAAKEYWDTVRAEDSARERFNARGVSIEQLEDCPTFNMSDPLIKPDPESQLSPGGYYQYDGGDSVFGAGRGRVGMNRARSQMNRRGYDQSVRAGYSTATGTGNGSGVHFSAR